MKSLVISLMVLGALAGPAFAALNVDVAPNAYGSANWAPWWASTKADVAAGSFTNMRSGMFPGELKTDPYEQIVYSTMDLGKRTHFIYYMPDKTIADLAGNFQIKLSIDWGGYAYALDWNTSGWLDDGAEVGWATPSTWEAYNNGTIGSFGIGWWATDNEALPNTTGGSIYDETNQADVDAFRAMLLEAPNTWIKGDIRFRDSGESAWQYDSLTLNVVPEPVTLALLGLGGLMLRRRIA
jgi:hypothetical protein